MWYKVLSMKLGEEEVPTRRRAIMMKISLPTLLGAQYPMLSNYTRAGTLVWKADFLIFDKLVQLDFHGNGARTVSNKRLLETPVR